MLSLWKHPLFYLFLVSLVFLVLLVPLVLLVLFSLCCRRSVVQLILFLQRRVWECRSGSEGRRNFRCVACACLREFHPLR